MSKTPDPDPETEQSEPELPSPYNLPGPVERVRAWVVEDNGTQGNMFGDDKMLRKERKSFFRRLAEKNGSPRIDWEDVIIMRKPTGDNVEGERVRAVCD